MPGKSKRKIEEMERVATDGNAGKFIRAVAKDRNIDRSTLCRDIQRRENKEVETVGYRGTAKRVFTQEREGVADQIKELDDQFHVLTPKTCCGLAFELADRNNTKQLRFTFQKFIWEIDPPMAQFTP